MHDEDRQSAEGNFNAMNPSTDCFVSGWEAGGDANLIPHRRNKLINVGGEEMREKSVSWAAPSYSKRVDNIKFALDRAQRAFESNCKDDSCSN